MQITVSVNGEEHTHDVEPRLLLVHFLRDTVGLTGTHWGCDTSNCGTCVVLMDGEAVKSCTVLAATASRYEITTVEGLERDGVLDPVQQGFHEEHGLQCGFCTPGMLLTARALLDRNPDPTDAEIREAISGQICRCTGYATIVRSIPSTVRTSCPSAIAAKTVHDLTGLPSSQTTHVPQLEVSQPQWVPRRPAFSRMKCTSSSRGSTSCVSALPLMVMVTCIVMPPDHARGRLPGAVPGW